MADWPLKKRRKKHLFLPPSSCSKCPCVCFLKSWPLPVSCRAVRRQWALRSWGSCPGASSTPASSAGPSTATSAAATCIAHVTPAASSTSSTGATPCRDTACRVTPTRVCKFYVFPSHHRVIWFIFRFPACIIYVNLTFRWFTRWPEFGSQYWLTCTDICLYLSLRCPSWRAIFTPPPPPPPKKKNI